MPKEIWKDIPEYEGLYQVSNFGRVKALNYHRTKEEKIIIPSKSGRYLHVNLYKNGKSKTYSVHKLVLKAFIGDSILDCNHKDGIKSNNYLNNLEYCTHNENIKHAVETGLRDGKGEKNVKAKLTANIVKNIRENKYNLTREEFAVCYNVYISTIDKIRQNITWKHV